jgi:hypothetical protein
VGGSAPIAGIHCAAGANPQRLVSASAGVRDSARLRFLGSCFSEMIHRQYSFGVFARAAARVW